jgi:hypothetical protein
MAEIEVYLRMTDDKWLSTFVTAKLRIVADAIFKRQPLLQQKIGSNTETLPLLVPEL